MVMRSRPGGKTKRLKARSVAKGFMQKVNIDEIYAATPAVITLRILLTLAQLRNHSIYMSDIQSAFLNTPIQPRTTTLVNRHQNVNKTRTYFGNLTNNCTDFVTHHRNQCVYRDDDTVTVYVDKLLIIGDDDKVKTFLQKLESQLQLKHIAKLQRDQPLVFLGRQTEYYNDHMALSMTKDYYTSLPSLYNFHMKTNKKPDTKKRLQEMIQQSYIMFHLTTGYHRATL
eukprot:4581956-Amphidinium_carterae.5